MPFSLIIDPVKVTITDDFCNETPVNIGGGAIMEMQLLLLEEEHQIIVILGLEQELVLVQIL